jgi:hypothetical protein
MFISIIACGLEDTNRFGWLPYFQSCAILDDICQSCSNEHGKELDETGVMSYEQHAYVQNYQEPAVCFSNYCSLDKLLRVHTKVFYVQVHIHMSK